MAGLHRQHFVREFRDCPQHVSALAAEPAKQTQFLVADDGRIIEDPGFVQFVAFAKLIRANAQTLRCVDGRFAIESEPPFGRRRGLARSPLIRKFSASFWWRRRKGALGNRQAIGLG